MHVVGKALEPCSRLLRRPLFPQGRTGKFHRECRDQGGNVAHNAHADVVHAKSCETEILLFSVSHLPNENDHGMNEVGTEGQV